MSATATSAAVEASAPDEVAVGLVRRLTRLLRLRLEAGSRPEPMPDYARLLDRATYATVTDLRDLGRPSAGRTAARALVGWYEMKSHAEPA